jgi:hypothetical protein
MQILCATDFSNSAMLAADVAALLAKTLNLPLRLVHCIQDFMVLSDLPLVMPDEQVVRGHLRPPAGRRDQRARGAASGHTAWNRINGPLDASQFPLSSC